MTQTLMVKDVVGYEGIYSIDTCGHVIRLANGKEMSQRIDMHGYSVVSLTKNGKQRGHFVHRLIAEAFIPNPEHKEQVNHIDGVKTNNNIDNLEWNTCQENIIHSHKMGLCSTERKVRIVETGEVFDSLTACAKAINGSHADISRCLYKKTKTHKGYHFEEVTT